MRIGRLDNCSELNNNDVAQIPADIFSNLRALKQLKLIGSKIVCNCATLEKVSHWRSSGLDVDLTCIGPANLAKKNIRQLSSRELNCSECAVCI